MLAKPSSRLLVVLFVVALVCALVVSGPVHVALHGGAHGDGCNICHLAVMGLPPVELAPSVEECVELADLEPESPVVELLLAAACAPRAPPVA